MRKLKFFLIGLIPGLVIVFFVLNKKGASCTGYLPNSRVIAESLSKDFVYSEATKAAMTEYKVDEKFLKDSIFTKGEVDFDKSHAQKKPCPDYYLSYPEKNPKFNIQFEKCEKTTTIKEIKKIQ